MQLANTMLAYVVLIADGKLHGVYTSLVDAHLQVAVAAREGDLFHSLDARSSDKPCYSTTRKGTCRYGDLVDAVVNDYGNGAYLIGWTIMVFISSVPCHRCSHYE